MRATICGPVLQWGGGGGETHAGSLSALVLVGEVERVPLMDCCDPVNRESQDLEVNPAAEAREESWDGT